MMKRNLLFAAMTLIAAVWSLTASAQEQVVTSTYLTNADFEASTPIDNHLCGYGADMAKNGTTYYGFQAVDGWSYEVLQGDNNNASYPNSGMGAAVFAYGSEYQLKGNNVAPPTSPYSTSKNGLGFFGVWGCGGYYYQEVTLPAGRYIFRTIVTNVSGTREVESYTGFIPDDGERWSICGLPTSICSFQLFSTTIDLPRETKGRICVGYKSTDGGSSANPMLFFNNVALIYQPMVVRDELRWGIEDATKFNAIVEDADLANAITTAQAIYDDETAGQDDVNEATTNLEAALTQANMKYDRTYLITNPDFNSNHDGWTSTTGSSSQSTATNQSYPNLPFWENWNRNPFTGKMYQSITGLEDGHYTLSIYASVNNFAGEGQETQYVYAGDAKTYLTESGPKQYFVKAVVADGTLEIGLEQTVATANWLGIDEARLYYMSPLTAADYLTELNELIAEAEALSDPNEVTASALSTALTEAQAIAADPTAEADIAKAAIADLKSAIAASKVSIAAAEKLAKMKALTENTNFYTAEALEAFETYYGSWQAKYEEGTLTEEEVRGIPDINAKTDWRANPVATADLLYSVWDCTPYDWNNYHVNTWSTEGNTDGSDFKVPFMEYWTGDGNSLAEKTLTATITDLTPGNYEVEAWVRVRMKNGGTAPTTGITMQVGEGEAVDVCTGAQVGTSQFYLDTFTATGTVGEDGVLTFKFNVAADNNISWLSFRDLVYTKLPDPVELATAINWENNMRVTASDELLLTVTPSNLEENGYTTTEGMQVQYYIIIDSEDNRYFGENIKAPFTGEPISVDFTQVLDSESHPFVVEPSKYFGVIITDIALLDSEDAVIATTEETIQVTVVGASDLYAQAKELAADADAVAVVPAFLAVGTLFFFGTACMYAAVAIDDIVVPYCIKSSSLVP